MLRSIRLHITKTSGAVLLEVKAVAKAAATLEAWEQCNALLSWSHYERLSHHMLAIIDKATPSDKSKVLNIIRRDYARQLYLAPVEGGKGTKGAPKT
ncbi:uncharacterized protein TrAtP1_006276 [Trichoderma atroviride]|uniref:uncharacterized protein n=1 Tax=Hypocrea atroviridis TaxID=63577 RepID=UPI00332441B8|nr:hypothetical protein TrAtP1_006276 [Trichoderma atroviride]